MIPVGVTFAIPSNIIFPISKPKPPISAKIIGTSANAIKTETRFDITK
ncbi:hypothetical protein SRABI80_03444 [Peribacillus frigoritolerans]|nr:hypothetical protein SRABI80_03444 [Peribacillus frigoritolerans]